MHFNKDKYIIVRVDEIGLKIKNKFIFMNQLKSNIKKVFKNDFLYHVVNNRIYLEPLNNESLDVLNLKKLEKIFGIHSYSFAEKVEEDFEKVKIKAYETLEKSLLDKKIDTFKVSVNRADKTFPLKSPEIAAKIGAYILEKRPELKVNLKNPDITVEIDIRNDGIFVFSNRYKGPEGLPVGVSSNGTVLLSGGIDSPVASILMLRRGMNINAVNFYSPPFTGMKSLNKILKLSSKISEYIPFPFNVYIVPLTKIQLLFKDLKENKFSVILQRRSMMRIANKISEITGTNVLITGESLGQVASQTLENLLTISAASKKEILRPLIGFTKNETINLSKKYGLYEISIIPYEDSCSIFVPEKPATKSKKEKISELEASIAELLNLEEEALTTSKKFEIFDGKIEEINSFKYIKRGSL
ncbi:tRNA uracil 4-sulfurtransferase ThiI [Petrotoga sp. 9PWA.NaAc.5.4]|uniref:tRNA uracil 4-sulfurtransferase ThiI n=1 Tax=Petrotoga sp. 9PWA.NaAc.5.4 TaxID=1434328 RepID=UPI000EFAE9B9|nr:tRNA uracil 4-sulfurtransferase ThiI [Petrotoga sp. 9PWA.NaAc.5.4]